MTTKQYLRFVPGPVFGIIASSNANILQIDYKDKNSYIAVPACENVLIWNLKSKEKRAVLNGDLSYVSCLTSDSLNKNIAVGYGDGMIRIFDLRSGSCSVIFCGHKSAVSCLTFERNGLNLASGGKDSEIVVWNVTDQAGLFRLKGHKGPISKCLFVNERSVLISSSKDTFIKFWDLDTQHCFQTLVGNRYEVLDFVVIKGSRLITGINGPDLKVWDLFLTEEYESNKKQKIENETQVSENEAIVSESEIEQEDNNKNLNFEEICEDDLKFKFSEVGKLSTIGNKTVSIIVDSTERILGCHSSTKVLQLFKILNPEEIARKVRKRKRKENKKKEMEGESLASQVNPGIEDEFQLLKTIHTKGKIDSFSISVENEIAKIIILLKNNSIFEYHLDFSSKENLASVTHSIELPGHRNFVRSLSYSSDSLTILSVSDESAKIWKRFKDEEVSTHTLECDAGLCAVFAPGNCHGIVGTKNGAIEIFDFNSQTSLATIQAHDGAVNCICRTPDELGVTSGSRDKDVKFWEFEMIQDDSYSQIRKRLSLSLKRTLKMPDEVLCIKYSPNNVKIAISLLDNTVQVLFVDSLKLIFSLYGHSLPVSCLDISHDSTLIVTGSEDRDLRIWSMEFGSCNKYIKKAHDKGITCIQFLPKTHLFFTGGRDGFIKQWDADNFQKIITLKGHQNDLTALYPSPDGVSLVTASKDKSIRIWDKTREPLVLEEEQEKEREEEIEGKEDLPVIPGEVNKEVSLPGIKSAETIKTVDQLIEAIDVYKEEILNLEEHALECKKLNKEIPPPPPHPLLRAYGASTPLRYMQKIVQKIKSSELEGTLLYLPFNYVLDFLKILTEFVEKGWETELCERCSSFLVRIHMGQIIASRNFQPVIEKLKENLFSQVYEARDTIGFVKGVCQLQQRAIDAQEEVSMFTSILSDIKQKKKRKKVTRAVVAFS